MAYREWLHRSIIIGMSGLSALAVAQKSEKADKPEKEEKHAPATSCKELPTADVLKKLLKEAANAGEAGGLEGGRDSWAAVVNRAGQICAVAVSTDDPSASWVGSQAIAKAKAYTANAFSTDKLPLSTARLYTLAQPGHSLYGFGAANPFNPACLQAPGDKDKGPKTCGGNITFGGGVPLYKNGRHIGGLGVSGDTACTDHEIAKRVRDQAGLNPSGGASADDIVFSKVDGASPFAHPMCTNTWRNGKKLGDEAPAAGY